MAKAGCFDIGNGSPQLSWKNEIEKRFVYSDYKDWCEQNGEKNECHQIFTTKMKNILPSMKEKRPRSGASRSRVYAFVSYDKIKQEVSKYFKINNEGFWNEQD